MLWIKKQQRKLRVGWWRFTYEIEERWPTFCPLCSRWMQRRDTAEVRTTSGQWVRMCRECKKDVYQPWS